ncbi:hypothetical protein [Streptomyces sp. NPDC096323]|uniref:hypothetical protein n=1 Tax=Streptomyces sp. NPDC096323 TaxID=3155822 RepID=UPI00333436A6
MSTPTTPDRERGTGIQGRHVPAGWSKTIARTAGDRTLCASDEAVRPQSDTCVVAVGWYSTMYRRCIPENEAIIRIPARMVHMIREACDAVERAELP